MKHAVILILFQLSIISYLPLYGQSPDLEQIKWIHGSEDCSQNKDPFIQVVRYDQDTWIFRQNKCVHYESPFMYLFAGKDQALLVDTGASAPKGSFPLYDSIKRILAQRTTSQSKPLQLKVIHSHAHGDHKAGDYQFRHQPDTEIIGPTRDSLISFLKIRNWPEETATYELGQRRLVIIPIPGHDQTSVAIYDPQTQWLLTGDSVYPGRLYVRDWAAYKASIARMINFSKMMKVKFLMGNHIEMSKTKGIDYPTGSTWQPDEQVLPMKPEVLNELYDACIRMADRPVKEVHNTFVIDPIR